MPRTAIMCRTPNLLLLLRAGLGTMPPAEALAAVPISSETTAPEATQHLINRPDSTPSSANVVSTLCNLLPIAGGSGQLSGAGIYNGVGLPPVPPKLAERICWWDFVDMAELLPEFWSLSSATKSAGEPSTQPCPSCWSRMVTDLASSTQCFAT